MRLLHAGFVLLLKDGTRDGMSDVIFKTEKEAWQAAHDCLIDDPRSRLGVRNWVMVKPIQVFAAETVAVLKEGPF